MTTTIRSLLLALPLTVLACSSAARPASGEPDVTEGQDFTDRPRFTMESPAIVGEYSSTEGCPGGFDLCDRVAVTNSEGKLVVHIGSDEWGIAARDVWNGDGVVLFSSGELDGDCDDPGCGNMLQISGVIYPVKAGDRWVAQVKATYLAEFNFPDEEGAPEGEVRTVLRLKKE